ncbi:MAG: AtpZ/AtpI family protein [Planctomycetota bacterium]
MSRSTPKPPVSGMSQGQQAFGAAATMAVSVALFTFGGLWLDQKFGTKPWLLLLMVSLGLVGGLLHLIGAVAPEMLPFRGSTRPGKERSGAAVSKPEARPNDSTSHDPPPSEPS